MTGPHGHAAAASTLSFSPDDSKLVTTGYALVGDSIRIWASTSTTCSISRAGKSRASSPTRSAGSSCTSTDVLRREGYIFPMMLLTASASNARIVCERTFPSEETFARKATAVSSSANSVTATMSYWPIVQ